jgi:hypothetical protein
MIDFLLPVVIGIAIGAWVFHSINLWRELDRYPNEVQQKVDALVDKLENQKLILLEVEAVDGQFLCYNMFTKEFVCMGRNMEEVAERFQQRYPDREAGIVKEDPIAQQLRGTK